MFKCIIKKFKVWFIGFFIIASASAIGFAILPDVATDNQINVEILRIEAIIKSDLQANGKYKRRDKKIIDNIEYEVHEYETAKGELGYQIFLYKTVDGVDYKKSIGYGIEADSRTIDWFEIQNKVY